MMATTPPLASPDLRTPPLLQGSSSPLVNTMLVAESRSRPPYSRVASPGSGTWQPIRGEYCGHVTSCRAVIGPHSPRPRPSPSGTRRCRRPGPTAPPRTCRWCRRSRRASPGPIRGELCDHVTRCRDLIGAHHLGAGLVCPHVRADVVLVLDVEALRRARVVEVDRGRLEHQEEEALVVSVVLKTHLFVI